MQQQDPPEAVSSYQLLMVSQPYGRDKALALQYLLGLSAKMARMRTPNHKYM